jgi:hypothetical protein
LSCLYSWAPARLSEEQPAIREEDYDDVDEISESESDEPGDGKSPSRGSQWDAQ